MRAPEFAGIVAWLNTKPLTLEQLKGKVVLIDFWTYTCVNCIRTFPHMREMWKKYKDKGLVIVGIHTPEFEFEKDLANIKDAAERHKLSYPIAVDSNYAMWRAYRNQYWPRQYLIDARGEVRWDHTGEGGYAEMERKVVDLLKETGYKVEGPKGRVKEEKFGILKRIAMTSETYLGGESASFRRRASLHS